MNSPMNIISLQNVKTNSSHGSIKSRGFTSKIPVPLKNNSSEKYDKYLKTASGYNFIKDTNVKRESSFISFKNYNVKSNVSVCCNKLTRRKNSTFVLSDRSKVIVEHRCFGKLKVDGDLITYPIDDLDKNKGYKQSDEVVEPKLFNKNDGGDSLGNGILETSPVDNVINGGINQSVTENVYEVIDCGVVNNKDDTGDTLLSSDTDLNKKSGVNDLDVNYVNDRVACIESSFINQNFNDEQHCMIIDPSVVNLKDEAVDRDDLTIDCIGIPNGEVDLSVSVLTVSDTKNIDKNEILADPSFNEHLDNPHNGVSNQSNVVVNTEFKELTKGDAFIMNSKIEIPDGGIIHPEFDNDDAVISEKKLEDTNISGMLKDVVIREGNTKDVISMEGNTKEECSEVTSDPSNADHQDDVEDFSTVKDVSDKYDKGTMTGDSSDTVTLDLKHLGCINVMLHLIAKDEDEMEDLNSRIVDDESVLKLQFNVDVNDCFADSDDSLNSIGSSISEEDEAIDEDNISRNDNSEGIDGLDETKDTVIPIFTVIDFIAKDYYVSRINLAKCDTETIPEEFFECTSSIDDSSIDCSVEDEFSDCIEFNNNFDEYNDDMFDR